MKKFMFTAVLACLAALFVSCEDGVSHTGDETGTLYGVWALNNKTEVFQNSNGEITPKSVDYSGVHFYLALSEFPFPHAIAKKGSFTNFDLDDVDVDAVTFTYNQDQKKISFNKRLWLSDELLTYNMILSGTFDVLQLDDKTLSICQEETLLGTTTKTTYTFQRYK